MFRDKIVIKDCRVDIIQNLCQVFRLHNVHSDLGRIDILLRLADARAKHRLRVSARTIKIYFLGYSDSFL